MKRNLRNLLLVTALLAAAPAAVLAAHEHGGTGMPGMGMQFGPQSGHYGPRMEKLAAQLKLNAEQRAQWDAQMQKSKTQSGVMRKAHQDLRKTVQAELARPEPDLPALAAKADAARDQGRAAHRELRDGWLKLYADFNAEQKGMVKKELLARMSKFDNMRDRMHERHQRSRRDGDRGEGQEKGGAGNPLPAPES